MLSKKSKYAIKALVCIAENYGNAAPLKISEISEREKIPRKFLETIMVELRNQGFVHSKMGANGGYSLAKTPDTIVLSQIIRLSGGPLALFSRFDRERKEPDSSIRNVVGNALTPIKTIDFIF